MRVKTQYNYHLPSPVRQQALEGFPLTEAHFPHNPTSNLKIHILDESEWQSFKSIPPLHLKLQVTQVGSCMECSLIHYTFTRLGPVTALITACLQLIEFTSTPPLAPGGRATWYASMAITTFRKTCQVVMDLECAYM